MSSHENLIRIYIFLAIKSLYYCGYIFRTFNQPAYRNVWDEQLRYIHFTGFPFYWSIGSIDIIGQKHVIVECRANGAILIDFRIIISPPPRSGNERFVSIVRNSVKWYNPVTANNNDIPDPSIFPQLIIYQSLNFLCDIICLLWVLRTRIP